MDKQPAQEERPQDKRDRADVADDDILQRMDDLLPDDDDHSNDEAMKVRLIVRFVCSSLPVPSSCVFCLQ